MENVLGPMRTGAKKRYNRPILTCQHALPIRFSSPDQYHHQSLELSLAKALQYQ
jgi:hypothetical protein